MKYSVNGYKVTGLSLNSRTTTRILNGNYDQNIYSQIREALWDVKRLIREHKDYEVTKWIYNKKDHEFIGEIKNSEYKLVVSIEKVTQRNVTNREAEDTIDFFIRSPKCKTKCGL